MLLMEDIYKRLHEHDLVETAEAFSTDWCWRSKSWFAVQKNKNSDFSIPTAISCLNAVKIRIALAHLQRKRLGSVMDGDIQLLGSVKASLEKYLLEQHRIAAVADDAAPKAKC